MTTIAAVNETTSTTEFVDVTTYYAVIPFWTRMISFVGIFGTISLQIVLCGQYKCCGECGAWRSFKQRSTFCCPSVLMIPTIYVCIVGLMGAAKVTNPDYTEGSDAAEFIDGLWGTSFSSIAFHTFVAILRFWMTVSRWQSIVVCEVFKTLFVAHVLYGVTKVEAWKFNSTGHLVSFYVMIGLIVVPLVVLSLGRLYYWVKTGFNIEKFEAVYLGHEPGCPIRRCLCLTVKCCGGSSGGKVEPEKELDAEKDDNKQYVTKETFSSRQIPSKR